MEAVELLIRNHLVNMQQYDLHLAQVWKELSGKRDSGSWEVCLLSVLSDSKQERKGVGGTLW